MTSPMAWCTWTKRFRGFLLNFEKIDLIFLTEDVIAGEKQKVTALDIVSCRTFLFFARYDVICDLLQHGRTQKWNLFVK